MSGDENPEKVEAKTTTSAFNFKFNLRKKFTVLKFARKIWQGNNFDGTNFGTFFRTNFGREINAKGSPPN